MLLDRLVIEAIRGVRNRIELPLDAALTVLLAANGTAKTSVCDATEWLLTGRVRRLQPGLVPVSSLLNRYAEKTAALVRANVNLSTKAQRIDRTGPESIQAFGVGDVAGDLSSTGEFLEQITPEYVGQTARTRNVEDQRAEWLRAVRFFNPDGLSLLLDDEEDAERVRAIAFAELLGVGAVGRRIKNLQGVRTRINSPRGNLSDVRKQIALYSDKLKAAQTEASAPHLARADSLLSEVATYFKFALPTLLIRRRDVLLTLQDRLTSAEQTSESHQARYGRIKDAFSSYQASVLVWSDWIHKRKPEFDKTLSAAHTNRNEARAEVTRLAALASDTMNRLGAINSTLGEAQSAVATVRLKASTSDSANNLPVGRLKDELESLKDAHKRASAEFGLWKEFAEQFPEAQRNFLQLDLLERQRLNLLQSLPSSEDQAVVQRRLGEANVLLAEMRTQMKASATHSQRWVAEVKTQLPNWNDRSECPLCGHDHQSNERLRDAIVEELNQYPSDDASSARRIAELEGTVKELQFTVATSTERQKQLREVERSLSSRREAYSQILPLVQGRGFDQELFTRADAAEVIAVRLENARAQVESARTRQTQLSSTLAEVQDCHAQLRNIVERMYTAIPVGSVAPFTADDPSLEERLINVEAAISAAQAEARSLRNKNEEAIRSAQEVRAKLEAHETAIKQISESFTPVEKRATEAKSLIDEIEESWRVLSGTILDESSLVEVAKLQQNRVEQLRVQEERLQQAARHLELGETAIKEEADRSDASKALEKLAAEERALSRIESLRTRLDNAIEDAKKDLNRVLTSQIRPLLRAISSFYLRTQGNAFIDSIGVDENSDENVLRWLGELIDAQPLAAVEMSQGQRQDLALSIFLARARQERGSFVLDEPLAHLDDLNRVAFFDTLRAMVAETRTEAEPFRMIITTASRSLVRHLRAKFCHIREVDAGVAFRILELAGDPRSKIEVRDIT